MLRPNMLAQYQSHRRDGATAAVAYRAATSCHYALTPRSNGTVDITLSCPWTWRTLQVHQVSASPHWHAEFMARHLARQYRQQQ
jgi:hypothetical protein